MNPTSTPRLLAVSALALAFLLPVQAASPPPSAQVLVSVEAPEKLDPQWKAHLCALLPQPCKTDSLRLLRLRGAPDTAGFTVIADEPLAMAEVSRNAAGAWHLGKLFDFRNYKHSEATAEDRDSVRMSLAPALYPLGPGRWAAAVLLTFSEMYSGGGAGLSTADFVPLEDAAKPGAAFAKPAHAGVAFSCYRMIRACFSEKEYKTSPHCHDETSGSLRITYSAGATPSDPYRWEYLWRETEWPARKPQRQAVTTSTRFTDDEGSASWCGGPQAR